MDVAGETFTRDIVARAAAVSSPCLVEQLSRDHDAERQPGLAEQARLGPGSHQLAHRLPARGQRYSRTARKAWSSASHRRAAPDKPADMLLKILFWLLVAIDAAGIGLWFLLGLAAAKSAHSSSLAVALLLLVLPGLLLAAAAVLFVRAEATGWRLAALLLVAAPAMLLAGSQVVAVFTAQNLVGQWGSTPLTRALGSLPQDPGALATVRELLAAGADANQSGEELPLVLAMRAERVVGLEPVQLLLDAGASPNTRGAFGAPAFFSALGSAANPALLHLLLARGAEVAAEDRSGKSGVWHAAMARNWSATLVLLQRGAGWQGRSPMGRSFRETLEAEVLQSGDGGGLRQVLEFVQGRERGK